MDKQAEEAEEEVGVVSIDQHVKLYSHRTFTVYNRKYGKLQSAFHAKRFFACYSI